MRRVAIVGGGVAGLSLAAALDPARFEVTIHEEKPERTTGAALGLWADARRALAGLGADVEAEADSRLELHRLDGRRLLGVRAPDVAQVPRPRLMAALTAAAAPSTRHAGERIDDARALDADLVVGADGVRSSVRGVVAPAAGPRLSTPWVALRGVAPRVGELDGRHHVAREFWGSAGLFGDAPVSAGRYWFTAHRSALGPEPLDARLVLREAREVFADAAPLVRATLADAADPSAVHDPTDDGPGAVLATRLWTAPALTRYVRGRYVVIGDAAHASLPNLGRGASDAIVDAVTLARVMNRGGSLLTWQARRVPVTQAARFGAGLVMRAATSLP